MNERIKELLIQSEVFNKDGTVLKDVTGYELNKFALLIVRECVQELETSRKCDPYNGDLFDCEYNTCINEQTTMLKEHFGVEL
jgi:hypothetical protein